MSETTATLWVPLGGAVIGLLFLFLAIRAGRRRRLIADIPTVKTTGVFIGLVELKGTAETETPLVSHLAGTTCVLYTWSVEEHWSRTVTETVTGKDGKTHTRTRTESGWKTVASGGENPPFYLEDDAGIVKVVPEGAKVETVSVFSRECRPADPLYYGKGPRAAVAHSDHRRRFSEQAIPLHAPIYVIGQARERQDVVAPEIVHDKGAPIFLISTRSEEKISSSLRIAAIAWFIAGVAAVVLGSLAADLHLRERGELGVPQALLAGLVYFGAGLLFKLWSTWNALVDLRQRVKQGWSLVEVELKRRADLIPQLVAVVTGLRDHEGALQTELAGLKAQLSVAPRGGDLRGVSRHVALVAEKFPELTAQPSFLSLQRNLSETEERIAMARGYYNEITGHYNSRIDHFPDTLLAAMGRMKTAQWLMAEGFERATVHVDLKS
jgi:hypothetical protein